MSVRGLRTLTVEGSIREMATVSEYQYALSIHGRHL